MAWRRAGAKPLFEPMLTQFIDAYMRRYGCELSIYGAGVEFFSKNYPVPIISLATNDEQRL